MTGIHITSHEALEGLRKARDLRGPDYVYQRSDSGGCFYWHGDEPGCIIGTALNQLGVTKEQFDWIEGSVTSARRVLTEQQVTMSDMAYELLSLAQHAQDTGAPWGAVVTVATNARILLQAYATELSDA